MTRATFKKGEKVERIEKALNNPTAALKQIGALLVASAQDAFRQQRLGDRAWMPRADVNAFGIISDFAQGKSRPPQRRLETRPALVDTGRLRQSIAFELEGQFTVSVGTNVPYASKHQDGGETESEVITEDIQKLLKKWLQSQDGEVRKKLRFLLAPKMVGERVKALLPKRPFLGITRELRADVEEMIGVQIMEVK